MATGIVGPGIANSQMGLQEARESELLRQMKTPAGPDQAEKIHRGATEFEALLLSGWLQQAEQSLATVPGGDQDEDGEQNTMTGLGVQALAGALAGSGGIGIGAMVEKAMLAMAQKSQPLAGQTAAPALPAEIPVSRHFGLNSDPPTADRIQEAVKGTR